MDEVKDYSSSQKMLLVGEGDFSFSSSLARSFGFAVNMVATSLDSKDMLLSKYGSSCVQHLVELEKKGCLVLHEVDVQDMNRHPILKDMKFDVIVYNFPHAGHFGFNETQTILIEMHKDLLRAFFKSARELLEERGEVHVTHRDDSPYNKWKVEELAREKDLVLKEKVVFRKDDYPGYNNKRGGNVRANEAFPLMDCFTFKFSLENDVLAEDIASTSISLGCLVLEDVCRFDSVKDVI